MTKEKARKFYDEISSHYESFADGNLEAEMLDNLWDLLSVCDDVFLDKFTYTLDESITNEDGTTKYKNPEICLLHKNKYGLKIVISCGGYTIFDYDCSLHQSFQCHINSTNTSQAVKMLECFLLLESVTCK